MTDFYTPIVGIPDGFPTDEERALPEQCFDSSVYEFNKGITPPPFTLEPYVEGSGIRIIFEQTDFTTDCVCSIACVVTPDLDGIPFCPKDTKYVLDTRVITVDEGNPVPLEFTFTDGLGNSTILKVNSLIYVKPSPIIRRVAQENTHYYVELGIPLTSISGKQLSDDIYQYQIQEYIGNDKNIRTIVDWTVPAIFSRPVHILKRRDDLIRKTIRSGVEYGYRVRYRSQYDEASKWSNWVTAKAPDDV